jgi:exodeoxyribonuclease VII large subunit
VQATMGRSQQATQHLELLRQKLASLDPKAVLQRGYAVVREENGAIARSAAGLAVGQDLLIQLGQGGVKVKVMEVTHRRDAEDAES